MRLHPQHPQRQSREVAAVRLCTAFLVLLIIAILYAILYPI